MKKNITFFPTFTLSQILAIFHCPQGINATATNTLIAPKWKCTGYVALGENAKRLECGWSFEEVEGHHKEAIIETFLSFLFIWWHPKFRSSLRKIMILINSSSKTSRIEIWTYLAWFLQSAEAYKNLEFPFFSSISKMSLQNRLRLSYLHSRR